LTPSSTSSFLTWSVQLIVSVLLQHHISKLSRCFWSQPNKRLGGLQSGLGLVVNNKDINCPKRPSFSTI
jgi:hypothetical protein